MGTGMPYQVKAGAVVAIVVDERRALEMIGRFAGRDSNAAIVTDVFGSEVDIAALELRVRKAEEILEI